MYDGGADFRQGKTYSCLSCLDQAVIFFSQRIDLVRNIMKQSILCVCADDDAESVILKIRSVLFYTFPSETLGSLRKRRSVCIPVGQHGISAGKAQIAGHSRCFCLDRLAADLHDQFIADA